MTRKITFRLLFTCLLMAECHTAKPDVRDIQDVRDDANLDLRGWSLTPKRFGPWKFGTPPQDKTFSKFCVQAQRRANPTETLILVCKATYDTGFMTEMELMVEPIFSKQGNDERLSALKITFPFNLPTSTSDPEQTLRNAFHFVRQASVSKEERTRLGNPVAWAPITQLWQKDPAATDTNPFANATLIPNPRDGGSWDPEDVIRLIKTDPSIHVLIKVKAMEQSYLEVTPTSYVLFHKQDISNPPIAK